jgi:hypothetical protein
VGASGFLPWVILGGGVVQAANSGSPLLDRSGSVVGIVAGKLNAIQVAETTGETTENVTFAVSLGTIQSFLDSHAVPYVSNEAVRARITPTLPQKLCATQCCLSAQDRRVFFAAEPLDAENALGNPD